MFTLHDDRGIDPSRIRVVADIDEGCVPLPQPLKAGRSNLKHEPLHNLGAAHRTVAIIPDRKLH